MKFNSNTWHRRLYNWTYGDGNIRWEYSGRISLCKYFWSVVLAIVISPLMLVWNAVGERGHDFMVSILVGGFVGLLGGLVGMLLVGETAINFFIGWSIIATIVTSIFYFFVREPYRDWKHLDTIENAVNYMAKLFVVGLLTLIVVFIHVFLFMTGGLLFVLYGYTAVVIVVGAVYGFIKFLIYIVDNSEPAPSRPPGLLSSFLMAKKQKVCPLLEWDE